MKVGILGGTFDPIHYGHLVAAEEARVRLGLGRVLFVPAGSPPHKPNAPMSPAEHRVAMVELAMASNPSFSLSRVDVEREGPSYSVDTVAILQRELGPAAELYFIMGLDSLLEIHTWYHPERLVQLCYLVVVTRPGLSVPDLKAMESFLPGATGRVLILPIPQLDISASDLRQRVASGHPIKYQVPEAVEAYIYAHQLYRRSQ